MISNRDLYRGRYLLAVYDQDDRLLGVETEVQGLQKYYNVNGNYNIAISWCMKHQKKKLVLIDCLERHNDCFKEEDKKFLEFVESHHKKSQQEISQEIKASVRTYYRKKKILENEKESIA